MVSASSFTKTSRGLLTVLIAITALFIIAGFNTLSKGRWGQKDTLLNYLEHHPASNLTSYRHGIKSVNLSYGIFSTLCPDMTCEKDCHLRALPSYLQVDRYRYTWEHQHEMVIAVLQPGDCAINTVYHLNISQNIDSPGTVETLSEWMKLGTGARLFGVTRLFKSEADKSVMKFIKKWLDIEVSPDKYHGWLTMIGFKEFQQSGTFEEGGSWQTSISIEKPMPAPEANLGTERIEELYPSVKAGSGWSPPNCQAQFRVAIVIPYRNRAEHLRAFLSGIIPLLQHQLIAFTIFVIEQALPELFNRASLINIGLLEASKLGRYDCFAFHDVDLIPEDACNLYTCSDTPRHMSVALDSFKYELPYKEIFGGITVLTRRQMEDLNGYSNAMFAWGGEDDNMFARLKKSKYKLHRFPTYISRYHAFKHKKDGSNPYSGRSFKQVYDFAKYSKYDGLKNTTYTVIETTMYPLYVNIKVRIPGPTSTSGAKQHLVSMKMLYEKMMKAEQMKTTANGTIVT